MNIYQCKQCGTHICTRIFLTNEAFVGCRKGQDGIGQWHQLEPEEEIHKGFERLEDEYEDDIQKSIGTLSKQIKNINARLGDIESKRGKLSKTEYAHIMNRIDNLKKEVKL